MTHRVVYRSSAWNDALEARNWYENRAAGLGDRFLDCLEHTVARISEFPLAHTEVLAGIRRALVPVFSYRVYYLIEPDQLVIIAIHHPSRLAADLDRLATF